MLHLLDVAFETFAAFPPKMVEEALIWRDFTKLGGDLFENCFFGADRLVSEAALEKQIEVEVVLTEEGDGARCKLLHTVFDQALGCGPNVEVHGPHNVFAASFIPVVRAKAELESMKSRASLLVLLVGGFEGLEIMRPVFKANVQARELSVVRHEFRLTDGLQKYWK